MPTEMQTQLKSTRLDASMFNPRGIAIVGASPREDNLGLRFVRGLTRHDYAGYLAVVNRGGRSVDGLAAFDSIAELPDEVELAVIAVAAAHVNGVLEELGDRGIDNALIFSSGFAEVGAEGRAAQDELLATARRHGITVLGPNCVGYSNPLDGVFPMASGFAFREQIKPGSFGIIAQSGGVAGLIGERAQDHGIGISLSVATGNEADAGVADVLDYMVADGRTETVALYLESVRRPQELIDSLARAREAGIGVAVFKAGTGERTAAAAAAHTGSLVGDDAVFDAMCRQTGTYRARSLDDLFLVPSFGSRLRERGTRVAILSTSGGAGVAVADACEAEGLELPTLAPETAAALAAVTPGFSSQNNPIDITGSFVVAMDQFKRSLEIVRDAEEFDIAVLVLTVHPEPLADRIAEVIIEGADPRHICVVWAAGSQSERARTALRDAGFAISESPDACARALGWVGRRRQTFAKPELARPEADGAAPAETPSATLARLAGHGAPVPAMARVERPEELAAAVERVGFPLVMKADGLDADHKTELGGVEIGIESLEAATAVWQRFAERGLVEGGVVLQAQVSGRRELLMTVKVDEIFGLSLVLGFGGTLTEAVARAGVLLPPITPELIERVAADIGLGALLAEFRGEAAVAGEALAKLGEALLAAAAEIPGLQFLEVNPVVIAADGSPVAVDALVDAKGLS